MNLTNKIRTLILLAGIFVYGDSIADNNFITVASTTSTENSGLYDVLLPAFYEVSGIEVRVVAVGTGKAIKMAQGGDADVLLVHHTESEMKFVNQGYGVERFDLMYNDFVLVGPQDDPAGITGAGDVSVALEKISAGEFGFTSRGDDSGTHKKELSLWRMAGVDNDKLNQPWYRETGASMGATLNVASGLAAYALTDRGTWLKFANKDGMKIIFEGDERMFNQYGVILVSPKKHPHIKTREGNKFIQWLLSKDGQKAINDYRIAGRQGFFANAR